VHIEAVSHDKHDSCGADQDNYCSWSGTSITLNGVALNSYTSLSPNSCVYLFIFPYLLASIPFVPTAIN
jgi:hypothetical protein